MVAALPDRHHPLNVDFALTPAQQELQARARAFVVEVLQPLETELEAAGGALDPDFIIFPCNAVAGGERRPTLFLVDYDTPGVTRSHDPGYTHTFADRHPQFVLRDVRAPASAVLGGVGRADELTNEWFVEERIH